MQSLFWRECRDNVIDSALRSNRCPCRFADSPRQYTILRILLPPALAAKPDLPAAVPFLTASTMALNSCRLGASGNPACSALWCNLEATCRFKQEPLRRFGSDALNGWMINPLCAQRARHILSASSRTQGYTASGVPVWGSIAKVDVAPPSS